MNPLSVVPALLRLPALDDDAALFVILLGILVMLSVGGRAVLVWLALRRHTAAADRLAARLEAAEPRLAGAFAGQRGRLREINASLERGLQALPAIDRRMAVATEQLQARRTEIDSWRGSGAVAARRMADRVRGTLGVLRMALRLRRTIWR